MQKSFLVPRTGRAGVAVLAFFASAALGNTIGVTNTNDSGPGSLRNAITSAAPGDTIYFNSKAIRFPATVTLASTLQISQDVTILGPGASLLSVSGGGTVEVLFVHAGIVNISGVTIMDGNAGYASVESNK